MVVFIAFFTVASLAMSSERSVPVGGWLSDEASNVFWVPEEPGLIS